MPRPWRLRYADAKYHLTVRGNGRATVFHRPEDYVRFLEQLDAALEADEVILYAYVLMPNHYHLFVETPKGNVQRFMQRLNTAYSMYHRYKHRRPGHCFQGRYGAKLVAGDAYVLGLTRYIHLNPVKGKSLKAVCAERKRAMLKDFLYSSYRGYAGLGKPETRIDYRWLRLMGRGTAKGNRESYAQFVETMLREDDETFLEEAGKSRYAIGDERFREETEGELASKRMERIVSGDIVWPEQREPELATVARVVVDVLEVSLADVRFHGHRLGDLKCLAVEWCCRLSGASQRSVAQYLGYGNECAVGKARRRARAILSSNGCWMKKERKMREELSGLAEDA